MEKLRIKNLILISIIGILLMPISLLAAMQSDSYIIFENIHHSFDGPVISGVSHSVSNTDVTVTWSTNVPANSFVEYSIDSGLANSMEQGTSVMTYTSHSVVVSNLDANTTYYYRVKSQRVNGGATTDSTIRSFTTGSEAGAGTGEEETPPPGGGGMLIIDKTDKVAPTITNVSVVALAYNSVQISWDTDEEATSFVEYGGDISYGSTYGSWEYAATHTVVLTGLEENKVYNFRALSSDDYGNVGYSDNAIFTTSEGLIEEEPTQEEATNEEIDQQILAKATQRALEFLRRLFPEVSLQQIGDPFEEIATLEELSNFVPTPILSGEPRTEINATEATIFWTTDIESNSLVGISSEENYNVNAAEPYVQIIGDAEILTTDHSVKLYGLSPNTTYHYQLRSKATLGATARSRDFTFTTSLEELEITSFNSQIIDNQTAVFKWVTNKETDSTVKFAPYLGNVLAVDQSKSIKDNAMSVIHEIEVADFIAGTIYQVELISADRSGNTVSEELSNFSTSEDDLPPEVSHIKADSTVFVDRGNKIQTILSWLTNEPATSQVYYQEGVHGGDVELSEQTELNTNYTKEHVIVISKFKPGVVYSFRVQSIDSGGNESTSKVHTFMTAKKKESIITIIMNILENTFGWMGDMF